MADRSEAKALLFESFFCILQLHELRFAEGSPICGADEKDNRALSLLWAKAWTRHVGASSPRARKTSNRSLSSSLAKFRPFRGCGWREQTCRCVQSLF